MGYGKLYNLEGGMMSWAEDVGLSSTMG